MRRPGPRGQKQQGVLRQLERAGAARGDERGPRRAGSEERARDDRRRRLPRPSSSRPSSSISTARSSTTSASPTSTGALLRATRCSGSTYEWVSWRHLLTDEYRRGGAYLIPHGSFDWTEDVGTPLRPADRAVGRPGRVASRGRAVRAARGFRGPDARDLLGRRAAQRPAPERRTSSKSCARSPRTRRSRSRLRSSRRAPRAIARASSSCSRCPRR